MPNHRTVAHPARSLSAAAVATVAVVGELSATWPPGPEDVHDYWLSTVFLAVSGALCVAAGSSSRVPRLPAAGAYICSVAFVMLATGGVGSGLGSLLMLPIVVMGLYGAVGESVATIGAVLAALLFVSMASPHVDADTARRLILFGSTIAMLSIAIHSLRLRLAAANQALAQQATTEERRRIARELHDGLAHELALIASRARKPLGVPISAPESTELANAAERALDEARRAITVLSATAPQSLSDALTQTAEDLGARLGVEVALDLPPGIEAPAHITENLLRIVREAMSNAARHGGPSCVSIRLDPHEPVRLTVEDDGCGFTVDEHSTSGFGLVSMRERAASIGAQFEIRSAPAAGTAVEVVLS